MIAIRYRIWKFKEPSKASSFFPQNVKMYWDLFRLCPPPSFVSAYFLHRSDARVIFYIRIYWHVLCNWGCMTYWGHKRKRSIYCPKRIGKKQFFQRVDSQTKIIQNRKQKSGWLTHIFHLEKANKNRSPTICSIFFSFQDSKNLFKIILVTFLTAFTAFLKLNVIILDFSFAKLF